jgi:glycosyltransferase involved in cell wall biosynthesis
LRIFVIGTRGFPDIQGGVEQHCENLYPLLASSEYLITVFRRKPYIGNREKTFNNIRFIDLPSTRISGFEAFYHSFLCTIICLLRRPDIVHIHNIGPGFFVPFLKIAGLKVIMTYHSPNYEHVKWSIFTRYFLKFAELISLKFSDKVIFVSLYQKEKLGNKEKFIHINNGVRVLPIIYNDGYIKNLGLQKEKYILSVGRFVEEKGFDLLIRAFSKTQQKGFQLVIAGDADNETSYSNRLRELAKAHDVILPGFVRGEKLQQLYSHSRLFVLPSYNEGLPIALLEAMSYRLPVLASNIQANLQVSLPKNRYFTAGDEGSLIERLDQQLHINFEPVNYDMTSYNWDQIAMQTKAVYEQILK